MKDNNLPPMTVVSAQTLGGAGAEYVVLKANEDLNTKFVLVSDTTYYDEAHISNKLRHTFWLPDLELVAGDRFFMWTGKGTDGFNYTVPGTRVPGHRVYHHYLELGNAIWNDHKDRVTLMFMRRWTTDVVHGNLLQRAA